jgi:hypothetical protein
MGKLIIHPQKLAEIRAALAAKEFEEKNVQEAKAAPNVVGWSGGGRSMTATSTTTISTSMATCSTQKKRLRLRQRRPRFR